MGHCLYNRSHGSYFDPDALEKEISTLMLDEDVTKKSGIYHYVLDRDERHLNIRTFNEKMKREAYARQNGLYADCGEPFDIKDMESDHIDPWHSGGKPSPPTAKCCVSHATEENLGNKNPIIEAY